MKKLFKKIIGIPAYIVSFFRSVGGELKKTEFPTRRQSFKLANIVLTGSIALSLILFAIDALFVFIRTYLINLNQ